MKTTLMLTTDHLQQLRNLVEDRCGIRIGDANHRFIEEGLARLMVGLGADSFDQFLARATDPKSGIRDQLVNAMISRETRWFRDPECFRTISEELLPQLEEGLSAGGGEKIRIWSAGCSTGQEPYSIAIALLEGMGKAELTARMPSHYEIIGTDISPAALFLAVAGRYDLQAMEHGLPEGCKDRYFNQDGFVYSLKDDVRKTVRFRLRNLEDPTEGLASGPFDVVLLRYVLEYYSEPMQLKLLERMAEETSPGGILLLGKGEQLPPTDLFASVTLGECACYRRQ